MKNNNRLLVALGVACLSGTLAVPARAIDFKDLPLVRPDGVAGLMFDDRLCFPEAWLDYGGINMLGVTVPQELWLLPMRVLASAVEAGADPGADVVAGQMLESLYARPEDMERNAVEMGRAQADGLVTFLECMAAIDPAVYQLYHDVSLGLVVDVEGTIRRFLLADTDRRNELADEMRAIGEPVVVPLADLLMEPSARVPEQTNTLLLAVRILGEQGPAAAPAAPALVTLFGDQRGTIRAAARQTLTRIGPDAVPSVIPALTATEVNVRLDAALVLGAIEPPPAEALAALQAALNDPEESVRTTVEAAIARIPVTP